MSCLPVAGIKTKPMLTSLSGRNVPFARLPKGQSSATRCCAWPRRQARPECGPPDQEGYCFECSSLREVPIFHVQPNRVAVLLIARTCRPGPPGSPCNAIVVGRQSNGHHPCRDHQIGRSAPRLIEGPCRLFRSEMLRGPPSRDFFWAWVKENAGQTLRTASCSRTTSPVCCPAV